MPAGDQPWELVGLKAEVSLLLLSLIPNLGGLTNVLFSFAKVGDSPLQAILSFLLVAAHCLGHLSHYVGVWPLALSHQPRVRNTDALFFAAGDKRENPPGPSLQKGRGSRTPDMNLILSSRGQWLTASLSRCWSRRANEVGSPRAANDILLPWRLIFLLLPKIIHGIKPRSCAHSPDTRFF